MLRLRIIYTNFQKKSPTFQPFPILFAFIINTLELQDQLTDKTKEELIAKCVAGDASAQKKLYAMYLPAMYNRAVRMLATKEEAKDVIQEVFIQVFKDLGRFRGESTLGTWIKRITINRCLTALRSKKKMELLSLDEQFDLAEEEPLSPTYDIRLIHQAIQKLPEGCRTVFNLYLIEGYQHEEIAQILEISLSTSKSQYRRAKILLQKLLKPLSYE